MYGLAKLKSDMLKYRPYSNRGEFYIRKSESVRLLVHANMNPYSGGSNQTGIFYLNPNRSRLGSENARPGSVKKRGGLEV